MMNNMIWPLVLAVSVLCGKAYGASPIVSYAFTSEPLTLDIIQGENFTIICEVEGLMSSIPVLWQNQSFGLAANADFYTANSRATLVGEEDGSSRRYELTVFDAVLVDEGVYECQIPTNAQLQQRHEVIVNIPASVYMDAAEPVIAIQEGESIEFECQGDGKPQPGVYWRRQRDNMPDGSPVLHETTLALMSIDRSHSGVYECIANNGYGDPDSATVQVDVYFEPSVQIAEEVIFTGPGEMVTLKCFFESSPLVGAMVWRLENVEISTEQHPNVQIYTVDGDRPYERVSTLEITDLQPSQVGAYQCEAGNDHGIAVGDVVITALPHSLSVQSPRQAEYSDEYTLSWRITSIAQLIDFKLEVHQRNVSGDVLYGNNTVPATMPHDAVAEHSYTIQGLEPNATYLVTLIGRNEFGESDIVNFEFQTPEEEILAPEPTTTTTTVEPTTVATTTEAFVEKTTAETKVVPSTLKPETPPEVKIGAKTQPKSGNSGVTLVPAAFLLLLSTFLSRIVSC